MKESHTILRTLIYMNTPPSSDDFIDLIINKDMNRIDRYPYKNVNKLIWYTWRNSLRILPYLSNYNLDKMWGNKSASTLFLLLRPLILFTNLDKLEKINHSNINMNIYRPTDKDAIDIVYSIAGMQQIQKTNKDMAVAFNIKAKSNDVYDQYDPERYKSASRDERMIIGKLARSAEAVTKIAFSLSEDCKNESEYDYVYISNAAEIDQSQWVSGLWHKKVPDKTLVLHERLYKELEKTGLDFIAKDLKSLINDNVINKTFDKYYENYSSVQINNVPSLRRLILGLSEYEKIHAVRVILIGPGGAGKTSLARRLQCKKNNIIKAATKGVDYQSHEPLNLKILRNFYPKIKISNMRLDIHLWDFAGQNIFFGLHDAFLSENCVYILVVDSRHEQAPDEWLYKLQNIATTHTTPKILVVTNWYEGCHIKQNINKLIREFNGMINSSSFYDFSCLEGDNQSFESFVNGLISTCVEEQRVVEDVITDVNKELLDNHKENIFISTKNIKKIISKKINMLDIKYDTSSFVEILRSLGLIIKSGRFNCINPSWIIDNSYNILYSSILRNNNGFINEDDIDHIIFVNEESHLEYLFNFLENQQVCVKIKHNNTVSYFFPDAAAYSEPITVSSLIENHSLSIRFDLPYLPIGIHSRLVYQLFSPLPQASIKSNKDVWREGFILSYNNSHAIVLYYFRKSSINIHLSGNTEDFNHILSTFYETFNYEVIKKQHNSNNIYTSVLYDNSYFNIESMTDLISLLSNIKSLDGLISEILKMTKSSNTYIKNNTIFRNDGDVVSTKINEGIISLSKDTQLNGTQFPKEKLLVVEHLLEKIMLGNISLLSSDTEKINTIKKIKEEIDKESPKLENIKTKESKELFKIIWNGLNEVSSFANNTMTASDWIIKNKAAIATILSSASSYLGISSTSDHS